MAPFTGDGHTSENAQSASNEINGFGEQASMNAVGVLLVGSVIKYADAVTKTSIFASIVLLSISSIYLFHFQLSSLFCFGVVLVIIYVLTYGGHFDKNSLRYDNSSTITYRPLALVFRLIALAILLAFNFPSGHNWTRNNSILDSKNATITPRI